MRKLENYTPTKFMAADSTYSKELADYAVNFIECLCHTKGTWAGKPFELIDCRNNYPDIFAPQPTVIEILRQLMSKS